MIYFPSDLFDIWRVADQQQLVMKARYEALAKEGGARAVKKAILKKQTKVSQSEKRSRPYKKHKGMEIVE
jgi:ribosomal RNA-processing protein 36